MKLVRFDFSKYERRPLPEELIFIREELTGISRNDMKFWALDKVHCEYADIIEESNTSNYDKIFIANANLANDITLYFPPREHQDVISSVPIIENGKIIKRKFIYTHNDLLREYGNSIKKIVNESELLIFERYYHEDYDSCSLDCNVIPYYPEIITENYKGSKEQLSMEDF